MEQEDYLLLLFDRVQWRRSRAILNLLKGKRTVSNLYAGLTYQLLSLYQLMPHLNDVNFKRGLDRLKQRGQLEMEEKRYRLTEAGLKSQQTFMLAHFVPQWFNGFKQPNLQHFMARLFLATQVTSEYTRHNARYYPLEVSEVDQQAVKVWFTQHKSPQLGHALLREWQQFLQQLPQHDADIYSQFLVGYKITRFALPQVAQLFKLMPLEVALYQIDITAHLINLLQKTPVDFPLLAALWQPLAQGVLSQSSALTYRLALQGTDLTKIAQMRRLRPGTITEHLLEAAILTPNFPYKTYLTATQRQKLATAFSGTVIDDWQYDLVAAQDISFFTFRLYQIEWRRSHEYGGIDKNIN
ncbi:hypothetical protein AYR54_04520 [Loigolactobacillus backii]|uniref:helix-turn-helix domain-containing protein n=1 Tax=Loigolactobacillus backii TaxID=375175 RepID=UPI0007F150EF|nr:helix-turn-helix domain-containing protein [Loigolactobacillus backii]ANK59574.1 hypothetical protein AYR52_04505 [Loigolactobacillus backii]ANK64568.1 hypothetical protein AYR54_04520 [Loigolactobacillus backii]ANK67037.1 hypothetical protein AYR55_04520 [Loigolactobacillus backii]OLF70717.1 hypothetical protein ACX53_01185 [Loigolactobacillus backii]PIO87681.1 hypothetical protein B8A32_11280 [Loigolactobacillus backii]